MIYFATDNTFCWIYFRMRKFNIPCPDVQVLKKHVLVMSFIGQDQKPAPKLKDARMSKTDYEDAYEQVISVRSQFLVRLN